MTPDEELRVIWQANAAGRLSDSDAQAAAEVVYTRRRKPPPPTSDALDALRKRQAAHAAAMAMGDLAEPLQATAQPKVGGRGSGPPRASPRRRKPSVSRSARRFERRAHVFGQGPRRPLDRNAKVRIMHLGYCLKRRTERGKHYGAITGKALDVLQAILWTFHNSKSGVCFPSYERIAEAAACARSTVCEAIKMLEAAGLLTWVRRLKRVREGTAKFDEATAIWQPGLPESERRTRIFRTSNAYVLVDPSKAELLPGTLNQESFSGGKRLDTLDQQLSGRLAASLAHLGSLIWPSPRAKPAT